MDPFGTQRRTRAPDWRTNAAPVSEVASRPMNASRPLPRQAPAGSGSGPSAEAVLHAASASDAKATPLRIDGYPLEAAHLQLSVLDRESEAALDQVECVPAKFLKPPATQNVQILADTGRQSFEVIRSRD